MCVLGEEGESVDGARVGGGLWLCGMCSPLGWHIGEYDWESGVVKEKVEQMVSGWDVH